jgi:hypothetical protein
MMRCGSERGRTAKRFRSKSRVLVETLGDFEGGESAGGEQALEDEAEIELLALG